MSTGGPGHILNVRGHFAMRPISVSISVPFRCPFSVPLSAPFQCPISVSIFGVDFRCPFQCLISVSYFSVHSVCHFSAYQVSIFERAISIKFFPIR